MTDRFPDTDTGMKRETQRKNSSPMHVHGLREKGRQGQRDIDRQT